MDLKIKITDVISFSVRSINVNYSKNARIDLPFLHISLVSRIVFFASRNNIDNNVEDSLPRL